MSTNTALLFLDDAHYQILAHIARGEALDNPCLPADRIRDMLLFEIQGDLWVAGLIETVYPSLIYNPPDDVYLILTQRGLDCFADERTTHHREFAPTCPYYHPIATEHGLDHVRIFSGRTFWADFYTALAMYVRRARGVTRDDYRTACSHLRKRIRDFESDVRYEDYSITEAMEYELAQDTTLVAHASILYGWDDLASREQDKHLLERAGIVYCWAVRQRNYLRMIASSADSVPF